MTDAIVLTILGMVTVMIVLYVISLMIKLTGGVVGSKAPKASAAPAAKSASKAEDDPKVLAVIAAALAANEDDAKIAAVITAAVAAYLGTSPSNLVVRPIAVSGGWALAGKLENTKKFC